MEELGIDAPDEYRGVAQLPIHGTSLAYTFDNPAAPTTRESQYYEIHGNRGIWHRGWKAVTVHFLGSEFAADRWELYNLDEDFSEHDDLASAHPEKLTELVSLWWAEAGRYGVLPLEDRLIQIAKGDPARDPEWKDCFSFLPGAFIPDAASCPDFFNRAFTRSATASPASCCSCRKAGCGSTTTAAAGTPSSKRATASRPGRARCRRGSIPCVPECRG